MRKRRMVAPVNLDCFDVFPVLETERLRLRELSAADMSALFDIFSDQEVMRYYDVEPMTDISAAGDLVREMRERYTHRKGIRWAIDDKLDGGLLGTIGFNRIDVISRAAVIGYEIGRPAWRRGFATEAVRAVVKFGHEALGAHRIEAAVMLGNEGSVRVLRKVGFDDEGVLAAHGHWKGQYHDLRMFSMRRAAR
jgi:[ribosomal protein S5]-alanine N-acetyltransferase